MNFLQIFTVDVRVDLRRCDEGMTEHFLYRAKIGTPFKQMRGKRMTECMWVDPFTDSSHRRVLPDNIPNRHPAHTAAARIKKYDVGTLTFAPRGKNGTNLLQVSLNPSECVRPDGNNPLLRSLAKHAYNSIFTHQVILTKPGQL